MPCLHDFVYHVLWKKVRVAERLSLWTQDSSCPLYRAVETLDHAPGKCLFHKFMFAKKFGSLCVPKVNSMNVGTNLCSTLSRARKE